jgi:acyl-CoA synthetase (NDP forming)
VPQVRTDLDQFFHPDGVAVVGRLPRVMPPAEVVAGYRASYGDRVYLVNPSGGSFGGLPVYQSVLDIPDHVGLAVISVRPASVAAAVDECGRKGIPYALVFTAGFSEVGDQGAVLEQDLADVARSHGMRIFGPNTNTNAFERMPEIAGLRGGKIGLLTQSGHQGRPIVQGSLFGVGFSRWVPTGNEVDLEVADFLEYFAHDDETAVIAGYFEGFKDVAKLRRALQAANDRGKPVVAIKIGSTDAGRRMASSHTGHLTGADAVVDGLFAQHGVTRVRDLDELLETAALFAKLPAQLGPGLCLYSVSGGSGTLMAETAEAAGLTVPPLSAETQAKLHELLPGYLTVANPVDNGGTFLLAASQPDRLRVLEIIAADPAVDAMVIGITGALGTMTDNFGADIAHFAPRSAKPVIVTWNSFKTDEQGFADVVASGVPLFRSFRNCFAALRDHYRYQERSARFRHRPPIEPPQVEPKGHGNLKPADARRLLESAGVPVVPEAIVGSPEAAREAAARLGFPVVMKVASIDLPHKSEHGLVRVGVSDQKEAEDAYRELMDQAARAGPRAVIDGVAIQQQVGDGIEMIVGALLDPLLGPAVMVGTGGIFAEILKDTVVRPLPIDEADAREMVESLRGYPLLDGARGRPPADVGGLVRMLLAVAGLAAGGRVAELDLNPVLVTAERAVAADWLVVLT